eukprot:534921-Rhodomonas_salina.1
MFPGTRVPGAPVGTQVPVPEVPGGTHTSDQHAMFFFELYETLIRLEQKTSTLLAFVFPTTAVPTCQRYPGYRK